MTLDVVREEGDWSQFEPIEAAFAAAADALARHLDVPVCEAAVALSSDARVKELNRTYRDKDKPTNVLSFPASPESSPPEGPLYLGDIVFAAETVAREAVEQDKLPPHHLQHLLVHGLLHLLGYDHETDEQATEMEALEVEILADLGIADPYAGEA